MKTEDKNLIDYCNDRIKYLADIHCSAVIGWTNEQAKIEVETLRERRRKILKKYDLNFS